VDDRPECTARPSPDVGTSDGAMVGERRPAQHALTGSTERIWRPTFRPGQPWVTGSPDGRPRPSLTILGPRQPSPFRLAWALLTPRRRKH
jgi:hypothetical protein